jgi:hypothetical protein
MTIRNARIHRDAIVPIGSVTALTTNGATTLTVPTGATGIILQGAWMSGTSYAAANDAIYYSLTAVQTAAGEGFALGSDLGVTQLMFDPVQTPSVYVWLVDNAELTYLFITKAGGRNNG